MTILDCHMLFPMNISLTNLNCLWNRTCSLGEVNIQPSERLRSISVAILFSEKLRCLACLCGEEANLTTDYVVP